MFFHKALKIAIILFLIGVGYRVMSWFFETVGTGEKTMPVSGRLFNGIEGVLHSLFTRSVWTLIQVTVVDVLFQVRILKEKQDPVAWILHLLIFWGFVGLLLIHAFDIPGLVSENQVATMNPYLFLRNLFGIMVATGLALAVLRRFVWMKGRIRTSGMDVYAIVILGLIVISGFLLEGVKITSYSEYQQMVEDYGSLAEPDESRALEAFWITRYGLVSPNVKGTISEALLMRGKEIHEMDCAQCHSRPAWAFASFGVATVITPFALGLDRVGVGKGLYYLHIISILFGLAYFAFSKMFHIFSTPVSLFLAQTSDRGETLSGAATRQMIEKDGCSHGGICHASCPVRKKREERIRTTTQFSPVVACIEGKDWRALGTRHFGREDLK